MTPIEILIKTEAIGAVFAEYLAYYKPIYMHSVEEDYKHLDRKSKRENTKAAMKDFHNLQRTAIRFSNVLEKKHSKYFDELIDKLHNSLSQIEINESKNNEDEKSIDNSISDDISNSKKPTGSDS